MGDAFTDLRATIKAQTTKHQELQASFLATLDSAEQALNKGEGAKAHEFLTKLGNDVFGAAEKGLPADSVLKILESASKNAETLVARGWIENHWIRIAEFKNTRCNHATHSCNIPDTTQDCYMVTICGEFKGCQSRRH